MIYATKLKYKYGAVNDKLSQLFKIESDVYEREIKLPKAS
jgi:hypothetical protein